VIIGATFDAEGYAPQGGDLGGSPSPSLADALSSIIWDPDRRFLDAQTFALDQLARIPGRPVTAALLKVLGEEGMSPAMVKRAARALVERKDPDAVDLFVEAIRVRSDFVTGSRPANLEVLARATGALRAKEAAAPLAAHLRLPETEPSTVVEIARALKEMQARETLPALRDYLCMYRADPNYEGDPSALMAVVDVLLEIGGAPERELLLYVAEDPKTLPSVRQHAHHALIRTEGRAADNAGRLGGDAP
jgi:DNA-binding transcriptional ArsR family regulator